MFKPVPKDFDRDAFYLARGAPSQKQIIEEAMASNGEQWADIEYIAIENMADLDRLCRDKSYTIWTKRYVYFPATYDGDNWTAFVPRSPCDKTTEPIGG